MKCLVIYDSYFGNTEQIAKAVGTGMGITEDNMARVDSVDTANLQELSVLVVGSPTRGFRPSERTAAFLKELPAESLKGVRVAGFDTRLDLDTIEKKAFRFIVKTGGYAAKHIVERLQKKGGEPALPPEGFLVTGEEGPLGEGELKRAELWGASLLEDVR